MTHHFATATNETTQFVFYRSMVAEVANVSIETLDQFRNRVNAAFDMGEPVWMIADEIKLRAAAPRKTKTPRALAVRVVMV